MVLVSTLPNSRMPILWSALITTPVCGQKWLWSFSFTKANVPLMTLAGVPAITEVNLFNSIYSLYSLSHAIQRQLCSRWDCIPCTPTLQSIHCGIMKLWSNWSMLALSTFTKGSSDSGGQLTIACTCEVKVQAINKSSLAKILTSSKWIRHSWISKGIW